MTDQTKDRVVERPATPAEEPSTRPSIPLDAPAAQRQPNTAAAPAPGMPGAVPPPPEAEQPIALLGAAEAGSFRTRWSDIQAGFVDEPSRAVQQADALVAELMQHLTRMFADERAKLEVLNTHREQRSTEDMRVALQRYRSFFQRLLSL